MRLFPFSILQSGDLDLRERVQRLRPLPQHAGGEEDLLRREGQRRLRGLRGAERENRLRGLRQGCVKPQSGRAGKNRLDTVESQPETRNSDARVFLFCEPNRAE